MRSRGRRLNRLILRWENHPGKKLVLMNGCVSIPEHLVDEFVKVCLNFFAEKKSPPAIFTGLSNVVRYLSVNHMIAIVTTNSSQNVNAFLVKHNLDGLIHAVYGVDSPGSKVQKYPWRGIGF